MKAANKHCSTNHADHQQPIHSRWVRNYKLKISYDLVQHEFNIALSVTYPTPFQQ